MHLSHRIMAAAAGLALILTLPTSAAQAASTDVGLGAAVGASFSATKLREYRLQRTAGGSFSWGFFVDIPIAEAFYITPAATLYELDFSDGPQPVTDIDLAFKFIAPVGPVRLGVGFLLGPTAVEKRYMAHVGGLAYASLGILTNVDVFAQFQYKRLLRNGQNLDDLHGYLGLMLRV